MMQKPMGSGPQPTRRKPSPALDAQKAKSKASKAEAGDEFTAILQQQAGFQSVMFEFKQKEKSLVSKQNALADRLKKHMETGNVVTGARWKWKRIE